MNYVLSFVLAAVLLWMCFAFQVAEAPKPAYRVVRPKPHAADLVIDCGQEHRNVCNARVRTEKVKAKT